MIGVRAKTVEVCTGTLRIIDLCLQRGVYRGVGHFLTSLSPTILENYITSHSDGDRRRRGIFFGVEVGLMSGAAK